jgi:hypothetical protein
LTDLLIAPDMDFLLGFLKAAGAANGGEEAVLAVLPVIEKAGAAGAVVQGAVQH